MKPAPTGPETGPAPHRSGTGLGELFGRFAAWTTRVTGGQWAFLLALATVVVWGLSGPFFGFSEMWQLIINTGTTIVTFLMVFLIQNAQNRESKAVHLKLDELIRAIESAGNELIDIEQLSESQLERLADRYHRLAERCHVHPVSDLAACQAEAGVGLGRLDEDVQVVERRVESIEHQIGWSAGRVRPGP